ELEPEEGTPSEGLTDRVVHTALGTRGGRWPAESRGVLTEVHCDPIEAGTDPDELPRCAELVKLRRGEARHATREHLRLPDGTRHRRPWQGAGGPAQSRAAIATLPARKEPCERDLLGRLALLAQGGKRCTPQPPENVRVAPLPFGAKGSQLPAHEPLLALELL